MRAESSVTRWVDYFAINGHLKQRKIAHLHKIYTKVQIFTNYYINSQKIAKDLVNFAEVVKFCRSGEISPNLVTLAERLQKV